jgi:hypothetical protein
MNEMVEETTTKVIVTRNNIQGISPRFQGTFENNFDMA